jgi:hypothetical protein
VTGEKTIHDHIDEPTRFEGGLYARFAHTAARHSVLFSGIALAWLWFSIAIWARWITLPDIPFLTDQQIATLGTVYNVGWWGILRPRIEKMKKAHQLSQEQVDG